MQLSISLRLLILAAQGSSLPATTVRKTVRIRRLKKEGAVDSPSGATCRVKEYSPSARSSEFLQSSSHKQQRKAGDDSGMNLIDNN